MRAVSAAVAAAALLGAVASAAAATLAQALPHARYVAQRVNHFDGSDASTWQQAYYANETFWEAHAPRDGEQDARPVFLCVGGEGPPIDGSVVVQSEHCNDAVELAPEVGALLLALEHRFYGCHNASACPTAGGLPSSAQGLAGLQSSSQALWDIAAYVEAMREEYGLTERNKVITFGGSYPGMLSGWARLRFPSLVHGAVASSAPVRAEVDMRGYYDVVAYAYAAASVGGSKACRDNIAAGHASILKQLASDAGRRELAKAFDLDAEWLAKRDNQVRFAGYGVANFPAQSNDDHCESVYCNVRKICALMDGSEDPVADLARLSSAQAAADGLRAWENRAAKRAARFAERDALGGVSADDLWVWQTCTEFAFYQTCEVGSDCMFAQGLVTLDVEEADCAHWAIGRDTVAANVAATNAHTGGAAPSGVPRVLWPHGEVDPWRANGVDGDALAQGQETWTVEGASHHEWTHPSKPTDAPTLVEARSRIHDTVKQWLGVGASAAGTGHIRMAAAAQA